MAKGTYLGISGVPHKVKKMYLGIGGVPRKVKKAYVGVGGVPKLAYSSDITKITSTIPPLSNPISSNAISNNNHAIFHPWESSATATNATAYNPLLVKNSISSSSLRVYPVMASNNNYNMIGYGIASTDWYDTNISTTIDAFNSSLVRTTLSNGSGVGNSNHRRMRGQGVYTPNYAIFVGGQSRVHYASRNDFVAVDNNLTSSMLVISAVNYPAAGVLGNYAIFAGGEFVYENEQYLAPVQSVAAININTLVRAGAANIGYGTTRGIPVTSSGANSNYFIALGYNGYVDVYDLNLAHTAITLPYVTYMTDRYGGSSDYILISQGGEGKDMISLDNNLVVTLLTHLSSPSSAVAVQRIGSYMLCVTPNMIEGYEL
jgi:hypothetical protein